MNGRATVPRVLKLKEREGGSSAYFTEGVLNNRVCVRWNGRATAPRVYSVIEREGGSSPKAFLIIECVWKRS